MISIVFTHLLNPENDRCLDLNLRMIAENTTCEYEVMYIADTGNRDMVYRGLDFLMRNAKYEHILWHSSDVVLAPKWNENVVKSFPYGDWIGLELVECGQIGVAHTNIKMDFGITADTFRRAEFEGWVQEYSKNRYDWRDGFGWYSPSVWKKSFYIDAGGFDLTKPFPHPCDADFRRKVHGCRFIVANSYAYHFQRGHVHQGLQPERE